MSREWNGSSVMNDFVKIAAESGLITTNLNPENKDFVGNPSKETPVEEHRRYEPTEEYNVTDGSGADLVQKAHPQKKVQVADAMGDGAVVENQVEQQEKSIEVATRMPAGALFGIHASVVTNLIKLAERLEAEEKHAEAARVDQAIERIIRRPFVDSHLYKEAIAFLPALGWLASSIGSVLLFHYVPKIVDWVRSEKKWYGASKKKGKKPLMKMKDGKRIKPLTGGRLSRGGKIVSLGLGVLGSLGIMMATSSKGIKKDTQELYKKLRDLEKDGSNAAASAAQILAPFAILCEKTNFGNKKQVASYIYAVKSFDAEKMEPFIHSIEMEVHESVSNEFENFKKSLEEAKEIATKIDVVGIKLNKDVEASTIENTRAMIGTGANIGSQKSAISGLQKLLFQRGFPKGNVWEGEVTGTMDQNTLESAHELEMQLDAALAPFMAEEKITQSFRGKIIKNNKVIVNLQRLKNILNLTERYLEAKRQ